ncbi:maleylpyruvate isomerase family mycothiol-dependent enzyme [Aeromicrobium sp. 50.2.37]|uniref:maleylpyruvate isomerase family mycothiol-dependent enzyme n=1 Tax=Aeromicrobium sp. 50.2.37 TaxID=2969305 RepID=UPI00214F97A8|nr:maleylpyruvate isomerase family mycothiol-dependent enzyme [Aeromicrobium sp. 50.2.37]MCR4513341.1 maleylpyruvate isomerase family mycothiol-dependent enzyme [Aeromicrobium sp. 50.2.37]
MSGPADDHRRVAADFTKFVDGVSDWDAPAPVEGWVARDVVDHLVTWFPAFLAGGGVALDVPPTDEPDPAGAVGRPRPGGSRAPSKDTPAGAWRAHADAVQRLLDGPDADHPFTHPHAGSHPLDQAVAQFYTADVFMHTWDLARASGQDVDLDADRCAAMLAGMQPIEEMLRASGQYGPAVPVPADASVQDRFVAFIGRDPAWAPPARA